jgi:hypothetical protein
MTKPAKRRRSRKTTKLRPQPPPVAATGPVDVPPQDLGDRDVGQDAWLLEREAEDIQRDGR